MKFYFYFSIYIYKGADRALKSNFVIGGDRPTMGRCQLQHFILAATSRGKLAVGRAGRHVQEKMKNLARLSTASLTLGGWENRAVFSVCSDKIPFNDCLLGHTELQLVPLHWPNPGQDSRFCFWRCSAGCVAAWLVLLLFLLSEQSK